MGTDMTVRNDQAGLLERVVVGGDLSGMTAPDRVAYYSKVCESLGLNPLTRPFEYITLNGKLTLYARKDATEQLRKRDKVSVSIVGRELVEDVYVVTARATLPDGRTDESIGAVSVGGLKGENKANAMMKAETKSKRRVTLSICGLGMLDETEVETIPGAVRYVEGEEAPPPPQQSQNIAWAEDFYTKALALGYPDRDRVRFALKALGWQSLNRDMVDEMLASLEAHLAEEATA